LHGRSSTTDSVVRAVVRDAQKARHGRAMVCEVAIADLDDAAALKKAFAGVQGVFFLLPPSSIRRPTSARHVA
jgi:uncharacterized protein YbjT (DUF2867 family)